MKPSCFLVAIGLLVMVGVSAAAGQTAPRPERPYRGLFGSGLGESEQSLTANASLAAGYDDNILARGLHSRRPPRSGLLGSGSGGLKYSLDRDRVNVGASAGTAGRYYPSLHRLVTSENGALGTTIRMLDKPHVTLRQVVSYRPHTYSSLFSDLLDPGSGQLDAPDLDLWISSRHYLTYTGGVGLSQQLSRRGTFNLDYDYRIRRTMGEDREFRNHHASAGYTHNLDKGLSLRLGYGYRVGNYLPDPQRVENHNIDVGVDFSRSLSFSRRTTVSFSTGTNAVTMSGSRTDLETSETNSHDRTRFRATGSANLTREIGRTWSASAEYSRGLRFSDAMDEPVFGDSAALGFGGELSRRLQFQSSARALFRGRTFSGDKNHFDLYLGTAGLSYALTRYVSLGLNYSYFRYGFDSNIRLATDGVRQAERQSVRASVNLWAPLFNRERSANVTR